MKIAAITAGAAGMYCGSCMHDNALTAALRQFGHDALLIPTFTPIRTDGEDVSQPRVFMGGVNVYLNNLWRGFRFLPRFLRRGLDRPSLLRLIGKFSGIPDYAALGPLTLSMLRGEHGQQRDEFAPLIDWLARDVRPDIVTLTNVLISGIAPALKEKLGAPILAYLQGDDVFLEGLRPADRTAALELIRANARSLDGFIATCADYADFMAGYLGVPRAQIDVILPGIDLATTDSPPATRDDSVATLGFLARITPEKGLHLLAEAYTRLRRQSGLPPTRLRVAGWLGAQRKPYLAEVEHTLRAAGLFEEYAFVPTPDRASKLAFLRSLDLFSVPATHREPKGLYVLEALSQGVPVVQPRQGSFPELVLATGGGILVEPDNPDALADGLAQLLRDPSRRRELGARGQQAVRHAFTSRAEAERTLALLERHR